MCYFLFYFTLFIKYLASLGISLENAIDAIFSTKAEILCYIGAIFSWQCQFGHGVYWHYRRDSVNFVHFFPFALLPCLNQSALAKKCKNFYLFIWFLEEQP